MSASDPYKARSLTGQAWKRLKRNKLAMFGLSAILLAVLVAALGGLIRPDRTPDANTHISSIKHKPPGYSMDFLKVRYNQEVEEMYFWEVMFFGGQPAKYNKIPITDHEFSDSEILVNKYQGGGGAAKGEKVPYKLADVLYPIDVSRPYQRTDDGKIVFYTLDQGKKEMSIEELTERVKKECLIQKTFVLGTDRHGRDLLSRLMAGTIISLSVGLISVVISVFIGVTLGAIAGFFKGWVDDLIMWLINVIWSVPAMLLVIGVTLALGKGFTNVFFAVGLIMWVEVARIVRGQVLGVREKEFVEAGRALGFNSSRLIVRHIIPNVMGPVIVMSAANFAQAILIEAGLSFLGIGAQPPTASWGGMIKNSYSMIAREGKEFLAILPGICIMLLVLAFMLVGNGLRDAFDTRGVDEEVNTGA
jgi:peptide/nickel transport system permease protein